MAFTDETIIAEFKRHLPYWQAKLRLNDLRVRVQLRDPDDGNEWCSIRPDNCGSNHSTAVLEICRGQFAWASPYDVWETCAHELVHAMNWSMALAFEPLVDHFSASQLNMAKKLMKHGNELLAYKWEAILSEWFAADAPSKEVP